jgi:8-oxo-dGTP pyrophosphatase MutT (NUDIX family)
VFCRKQTFIFLRTVDKILDSFSQALETALSRPLPGIEAQKKMSPETRRQVPDPNELRPARHGAVLLLLYEKNGEIYFPLIQRPEYDGVHGGQVSLPGGKVENGDPSLAYTALRETEEEIGVPASDIEILGKLSDLYIWVSHFHVHPFVGKIKYLPEFVPDPHEVAQLIETPLSVITDASNRTQFLFKRGEFSLEAPCFVVQNKPVWGATAMILSEFCEIIFHSKLDHVLINK